MLSKQTGKYRERQTHTNAPPSKAMNQFFSDCILNDNLAMLNVTAEGAAEALFLQLCLCWWINQVKLNLNFYKANERDRAKRGTAAVLSAALSWEVTALL